MNRLDRAFADARAAGRKTLMPFLVGGAPGVFPRILAAVERAGAGVIEVGMPFSDPVADGPVIAAAMHRALAAGVTPASVFRAVREARDSLGVRAPIVFMTSVSVVERLGAARFAADAAAAGADGVIFPDAPLEEIERFSAPARDAGLAAALLVAPTTPAPRAAAIARASSGFVYLLARAGVTGAGASTDHGALRERVLALRAATTLPICAGFGVSTPEHVRAVTHDAGADGAIVGSALVAALEGAPEAPVTENSDPADAAHKFVSWLGTGLISR